jgi:Ca-activated chloride channel family protein
MIAVIRAAVFAVAVLLSSCALALGSPQAGEPSPENPAPSRVSTLVEVLDPKARVPRDLTAESFTVAEEGQPRRVLNVEPVTGEAWRFVLYFDRVLASSASVRAAAGALAQQIIPMAGMGTVEVVVAEPEPRVLVPATRDVRALDEALSQLFLLGEGRDDVRMGRQRFREEVRQRDAPGAEPAAELAREAIEDEAGLVRRQLARLTAHLAAEQREGDRVLFLVSDGFDLDPRGFHMTEIPRAEIPAGFVEELAGQALEKDTLETARGIAALGWTVYALPFGDEKLPEVGRFGFNRGRARVTFDKPEKGEPETPPPPPPPALLAPQEPLRRLAEAAGGEVLTSRAAVAETLPRLRSRLRLSYETDVAAGPSRGVEVGVTDPRWTVRSRRWEGPALLEEVSALRARELLDGAEETGDLQVAAELRSVTDASGGLEDRLEVRLEAGSPPDPGSRWRLTIARPSGGGRAEVRHRIVTAADLIAGEEGWTYQETVPPPGGERLGVLVEDLAAGTWGGDVALIQLPETAEAAASLLEPAVEPAPRSLIDSGFGVRLIAPASGRGLVPVEAEVRVPQGRRVDRIELFWNEELTATLYGPPFRHRVRVPYERPEGYLRAVARLDDGSIAEDALAMNSATVTDRVDVRLMELLVVVTDRSGKPVRGLTRDRFKVRKSGVEQQIASFEDAGRMPLTLALAIDSSASMFLKIEKVRRAAASLLGRELSARDSALLVDFDTQPRLVAGLTRDLPTVSSALDLLQADGGSGLWEAIAFSVEQLQAVRGRKALVVYSDGVGEGEPFSYRASLRRARASGIPVYLIVTNAQSASRRPMGGLRSYAAKIQDLAEATGGKAFFVAPDADLGETYSEILAELRSQYTLAFYPKGDAADEVQVEVEGRGLTTRTVAPLTP